MEMKERMIKRCRRLEEMTEKKAALIITGAYTKEEQNRAVKTMSRVIETLCDTEDMKPCVAEWILKKAAEIVIDEAMNRPIT